MYVCTPNIVELPVLQIEVWSVGFLFVCLFSSRKLKGPLLLPSYSDASTYIPIYICAPLDDIYTGNTAPKGRRLSPRST